VSVSRGPSRGHVGTVIAVLRDQNRLVVRGANKKKRHVSTTESGKGGIFEKESPIHYSAVALIDPVTKKPSKVTYRFLEDGTKVRVAKKSGAIIPKKLPLSYLNYCKGIRKAGAGPKDTPPSVVLEKTLESVSLNNLD